MSPRKTEKPCYGIRGEGCPATPSYEYQPYPDMPAQRICGVHAELVRKHYVRSKRLRKLLSTVLRMLPGAEPAETEKVADAAKNGTAETAVAVAKRPVGRPRKNRDAAVVATASAEAEREVEPALA